jgi:hypothetical protein
MSRHEFHQEPLFVLEDVGNTFREDGLCVTCLRPRTEAGHDACIAHLLRTLFACCGHGRSLPYLAPAHKDGPQTEDEYWAWRRIGHPNSELRGATLVGAAAFAQMRALGGLPPDSPPSDRIG